QLFGGSLTLRDYDGQVAEAMALVRALNKMTKAGMPENTTRYGGDLPEI
ncbi:IS5/IS1182 family transposase, partial [Klebsiella sp. 1SOBk12mer]|nr:IS5/IS1182 family transposase [Klebsiella oxytoca]MDG3492838.1 IS5/IS1182 family transposase [Klebsiella pneumoniae]MDW0348386.1 IS5/IS1182 family transposase [Klebsiella variicola]